MKLKNYQIILLLVFLVVLLFYPALFNFFSHDDWFHFKIAEASNLKEFLTFFDLRLAPEGWGYYRPLTTQVLYLLVSKVFNFNPVVAHCLAFLLFFIVLYLVYKFIFLLTQNKNQSILAIFLYATSATHFSHLYSIANQELGHAIFFLSSILLFFKFFKTKKIIYYLFSIMSFIIALTCKEFAFTLPVMLGIVGSYLILQKKIKLKLIQLIKLLIPYLIIAGIYGYLHYFAYGTVQGDSYIWVFSPKVFINNIFWYGLWSLNLPKMLVDYITLNLQVNPNLFIYWSREIIPIFVLFCIFIGLVIFSLFKNKKQIKKDKYLYAFSFIWFGVYLTPVLFLPWHKFTTYLTLPLIGVVLLLSKLLFDILKKIKQPEIFTIIFFGVYISLSALTLNITRQTDWISQGAKVSQKIHNYFYAKPEILKNVSNVIFYDNPKDSQLPWSPADQVRLSLSDNNYWQVFYDGKIKAYYLQNLEEATISADLKLPARQFLEY
jgi:hypothetical protein